MQENHPSNITGYKHVKLLVVIDDYDDDGLAKVYPHLSSTYYLYMKSYGI